LVPSLPPIRIDDQLAVEWHDLMGRYHRLSCALDRALQSEHGISGSDFEVLQQLDAASDGTLHMHELAAGVHLTQSALSRLVSKLEAEGLVTRCMCTEDRRSVVAAITAEGRSRYVSARPTQRAILRAAADEDAVAGACD
jgi:DNA-binding MarR family transcriptional regulator